MLIHVGRHLPLKILIFFFRDNNNSPVADLITIKPLEATSQVINVDSISTNDSKSSNCGALIVPPKTRDYINIEALWAKPSEGKGYDQSDDGEISKDGSDDILNSVLNVDDDDNSMWNWNSSTQW